VQNAIFCKKSVLKTYRRFSVFPDLWQNRSRDEKYEQPARAKAGRNESRRGAEGAEKKGRQPLLSRNDAVALGSAVVSTAVFGVSPKTLPFFGPASNSVGRIIVRLASETPTRATGTVALPNPSESFRLRQNIVESWFHVQFGRALRSLRLCARLFSPGCADDLVHLGPENRTG
jgi:hypothetical protein